MRYPRSQPGAILFAAVFLAATCFHLPPAHARRCRVGIAGEHVTGYNGLLARLGLPREVILDYQLSDPQILRRYDLILVSSLNGKALAGAMEPILSYVREGGHVLLDSNALPPATVVAGARGAIKKPPRVQLAGEDNPLVGLLGASRTFACSGGTHFLDPQGVSEVRVLARYEGRLDVSGAVTPVNGYTGTPAIWEMPLGYGRLCYSGPSLGWSLSLVGKDFVTLATALIDYLGTGVTEPQLVPEGLRLGEGREDTSRDGSSRDGQAAAEVRRKRPAGSPGPLPDGAQVVEGDTETPELDLSATYAPGKGRAEVFLCYWSARTYAVVALAPGRAALWRVEQGRTVARVTTPLPERAEVPVVIKQRRASIGLWAGGKWTALPLPVLWEGKVAVRGGALSELRAQPVEPVFASDDFMRTAGEADAWEVVSGQWSLPPARTLQMGTNPFTYQAAATGTGWATTGYRFWDEYTLQASVKPTGPGGAVGLGAYLTDAQNHLSFRAPVQGATQDPAARFEITSVREGRPRVLAHCPGSLRKGQWYRLALQVKGDQVTASIDGRPILTARDSTFSGGKAALMVQDGSACFDDVLIQPAHLPLRAEGALDAAAPHMAGIIDADTWASPGTAWNADRDVDGLFWRRGLFYGDIRLGLTLPASGAPDGTGGDGADPGSCRLTLTIDCDGAQPDSGYAFTVRRVAAPAVLTSSGPPFPPTLGGQGGRTPPFPPTLGGQGGQGAAKHAPGRDGPWAYRAAILRRGVVVAEGAAVGPREPMVRLQRSGWDLIGFLGNRPLVRYSDPDPLPQLGHISFRAEGGRPRLSTLRLQGDQVLDYTFEQAPTDWWIGGGTWEITSRWSCTPSWSWFGGLSREVAAIWNKRRFAGDVVLDYYVGPRMVDWGAGRIQEVTRALNCVICGDGQSVTTGYSFQVGAQPDGSTARLIRNGEIAAVNKEFGFATAIHNRWLNIRVEKRGATVGLWVEGQPVLSWTDPHPLTRGYAGIWTRDNGIMVPRVTLYYQGLAQ